MGFHTQFAHLIRTVTLAALVLWPVALRAQDTTSRGLFDGLFSRGEPVPRGTSDGGDTSPVAATPDDSDLVVRLDRIENTLRQLTGTIEQLQYRNQQLERELRRIQDEYRYRQGGVNGGAAPDAAPVTPSAPPNMPPGATRSRRSSDSFDPAEHPNAPGAPRLLGAPTRSKSPIAENERAFEAPDRQRGAPLDLSTASRESAAPVRSSVAPVAGQRSPLPPSQNQNAEDTQLATLPPSALPQDAYDLAYGYVLHKDYALAEQAFREFLARYPNEHLVPDVQYWLGEALFQQQRYREAAESFLAVSTKYDGAAKAPESLLRLGQSLAALQKKDAACVTFAEIERKYPRASASVKRSAEQELKRAHC